MITKTQINAKMNIINEKLSDLNIDLAFGLIESDLIGYYHPSKHLDQDNNIVGWSNFILYTKGSSSDHYGMLNTLEILIDTLRENKEK